MLNIQTNIIALFFLGMSLLIADVIYSSTLWMSQNMQGKYYDLYEKTGINTQGSTLDSIFSSIAGIDDIIRFTLNFSAFFLIGYSIFSSFFTRATPLNFILGVISSIIIGGILNFVFILMYNAIIEVMTNINTLYPEFIFSNIGSYVYSNFSFVLIANVLAGVMSFLYSSVSTKFNKGGLLGL